MHLLPPSVSPLHLNRHLRQSLQNLVKLGATQSGAMNGRVLVAAGFVQHRADVSRPRPILHLLPYLARGIEGDVMTVATLLPPRAAERVEEVQGADRSFESGSIGRSLRDREPELVVSVLPSVPFILPPEESGILWCGRWCGHESIRYGVHGVSIVTADVRLDASDNSGQRFGTRPREGSISMARARCTRVMSGELDGERVTLKSFATHVGPLRFVSQLWAYPLRRGIL